MSLLLISASCLVSAAVEISDVLVNINVDFELLDRSGDPVKFEHFNGKNVLLAFGFTHCMHICPIIAANMANTLKVADKEAIGIFVSVDTERDTPAITDDYAKKFSDRMIGLGGSFEQVSAAVKNFNATYVVTKSEDNYTVQHTPSIFLIGPNGTMIDVFAMNAAPGKIARAMR